jgi:biotin carboxylase
MGLKGNSPSTSKLRREKFEMQQAIKYAGLNSIESIKTKSVDEAIDFFLKNKYQKVIIKPPNSAGSDGVYSCSTCSEICVVFGKLLNEINSMGEINSFLIVQEQIEGVQYIVNSISIDGNHSVVDFWQESRLKIPVYGAIGDREYLIPNFSQSNRDRLIIEYAHQCLDAIGLQFGASHTEVFWCNHRSAPILIEVGARLQGSICEDAVTRVLGTSQVKVLSDLLIDPMKIPSSNFIPEESASHCMAVLMIAKLETIVTDISPLQEIIKMPEFIGGLHLPTLGQKIPKTVSMETCPGVIYLSSKDKESLEKAYQKVRLLELELFKYATNH